MFVSEKILVGKTKDGVEAAILPKMANRHGLITGASGSGKTVTLKVLAESFSAAGIPVFLTDVKGDLAGMSQPGDYSEKIKERVEGLKLEGYKNQSFPTQYFDMDGKSGHPIRTTVSSVGPRLLARLLDLSDAQEEILGIIFKISADEHLELDNLDDLNSLVSYVDSKKKEYSAKYGNLSTQSLTTIRRAVMNFKESGDNFFGEPAFDIHDLMRTEAGTGRGYISVLDAENLFKNPTTYVTTLLWLLTTIYNELPEVGDLDRPKLIFFLDEAHLIFSEMKDGVIKQLVQIVKLIRSKGVGLYFVSQSPSDIKDEILSQLGNRVQHVLRAYTKTDEKSITAAANGFRKNPNFNTEETIKLLATGEALVSFQTEKGEPSIVEKVTILPPESRMGTISPEERQSAIRQNSLYGKYENATNDDSATEKIERINEETKRAEEAERARLQKEKEDAARAKEAAKTASRGTTTTRGTVGRPKKSTAEKAADKLIDKTLNKLTSKLINSIFK
ncbi:DUF853 family protein [Candidatus Saccharibacteria bacterium]|nr:DUF853 family protein [Candidatus Saccharibacteria bacterium]